MTSLDFSKDHAIKAIRQTQSMGTEWLYQNYPASEGNVRRSTTGFIVYEGASYPVKPLGRLAYEIAGEVPAENWNTNKFRRHFQALGFQLADGTPQEIEHEAADKEAESANARQRRLANIWQRPEQAKFRREVFQRFGSRCLVTGCQTLVSLEAAHVLPVSSQGTDEPWNGIPLRADIHRLFDAKRIRIVPDTWTVSICLSARYDYQEYEGLSLSKAVLAVEDSTRLQTALRMRYDLDTEELD